MSKNLVLTMCIGEKHLAYGHVTLPTIQAYAERLGADCICMTECRADYHSAHWMKFAIGDYLKTYERVLWIDADCLVRPDAPSLFDVVPFHRMGMFDVSPYHDLDRADVHECIKLIHANIKRHGTWYNTGVMVVPRSYRALFLEPDNTPFSLTRLFDQEQINQAIWRDKLPVFDIGYMFNHTSLVSFCTGADRFDSWIIHYAGVLPDIMPFVIRKERVLQYERYSNQKHSTDAATVHGRNHSAGLLASRAG